MYSRCILTLILFKMTRPDGGDRGNRGRLGHFSYTLRLLPRYFTQVFKNLPTDHQCCSVQNQYVSDFPQCTIFALDRKLQPLVICPSLPRPWGTLGQRLGITGTQNIEHFKLLLKWLFLKVI